MGSKINLSGLSSRDSWQLLSDKTNYKPISEIGLHCVISSQSVSFSLLWISNLEQAERNVHASSCEAMHVDAWFALAIWLVIGEFWLGSLISNVWLSAYESHGPHSGILTAATMKKDISINHQVWCSYMNYTALWNWELICLALHFLAIIDQYNCLNKPLKLSMNNIIDALMCMFTNSYCSCNLDTYTQGYHENLYKN